MLILIKMHYEKVMAGDIKGIAELISLIEDNSPKVEKELEALRGSFGTAHIIGITGSPGSGKSTLAAKLTLEYRKYGNKVGILAIDPTSPFGGGALLGDRIRMRELFLDSKVYIRSMATRGRLGGLSNATYNSARVLEAAGYNPIFIETVGVGQAEVDIVNLADTTLVVLTPGYGDEVQTIKAGIMEIADVFVVNKADKDGTNSLVMSIESMLDSVKGRKPMVYKTIAIENDGIEELKNGIAKHLDYLKENNLLDKTRKMRLKKELVGLLSYYFEEFFSKEITEDIVERVYAGELSPSKVIKWLLERYKNT